MANAYIGITLYKDSLTNPSAKDETLISFNPSNSTTYVRGEDAPYLQGFGAVSLSNISTDSVRLAVGCYPYYKGETIGLSTQVRFSGTYLFDVTQSGNMPDNPHIHLRDSLLHKSARIMDKTYQCSIDITKPETYTNRFYMVFK